MEFLDEESRPRFLFQSRPLPQSSNGAEPHSRSLHKPSLFISLSISLLLFALSFLLTLPEPLRSLIFWLALSLLLGPFAPSSITAGDIRVGVGPTIPPPPPSQTEEQTNSVESNKRSSRKSKPRKHEELGFGFDPKVVSGNGSVERGKTEGNRGGESIVVKDGDKWSDSDADLLKKLMVKHPVGKPGRWEAIAEAFNGRHGVEGVIKKAKGIGEKKMTDEDSFQRFLKDRKPLDKKIVNGGSGGIVENDEPTRENGGVGGGDGNWSSAEDVALLNALKAFPKEVSMRWEKIAAAVPGKSKAACMKRMSELKKGYRSSKASAEA